MNLTSILGITTFPIGIACASLVLLTILGIACINRKLANRMTVRLIFSIALADVLKLSSELYSALNGNLEAGTPQCARVNAFKLFSRTFYCFTNMAICFHLFRGIVKLKKSTWKYELKTWIGTLALVIIFTFIYYFMGAFGGGRNKVGCNPGPEDRILNIIFYLISVILNLVTMISSVVTTIIGHKSLTKWINTYANSKLYQGGDQAEFIKNRRKMAERAFLYPLSTIISLPFETIFLLLKGFDHFILWLTWPMVVGTALSGILTGIAFYIDPAVHKACEIAYYNLKIKFFKRTQSLNSMEEAGGPIPLTNKT